MTRNEVKPPLLVLIGPTAVGKTNMSLSIAHQYHCEVISGDSMQVYREMDIGTAKLPEAERRGIPHHLIDVCSPDEPFSVAEFQQMTHELIHDIRARGRLPFIVGGTGLYIESVCYGYQFTPVGENVQYREQLAAYVDQYGSEALHDRLREIDPESADRLHPNDRRRVIRALEIYRETGRTLSEQLAGQMKQSPFELCLIGLTMERGLLYKRIEQRVDEMVRDGLLEEVKHLVECGYSPDLVSMHGLGYKEMAGYLRGDYSFDLAVDLLKRNTRRFAKRQLSWFRRMPDIHWVDVGEPANFSAHFAEISDIIAGKFPKIHEYIQNNLI